MNNKKPIHLYPNTVQGIDFLAMRLKNFQDVLKKLSESKDYYYCNIATNFMLSSKELTSIKEKGWKLVSFNYIIFTGYGNCYWMHYIFERRD